MKSKIFLFVIILSSLLLAKNKGIISGYVTEQQTGQPLTGANVIIVGTSMGSAADNNGFYKIENIPVGIYSVKASYVGYKSVKNENVKVSAGTHKKINFKLTSEPLPLHSLIKAEAMNSAHYLRVSEDYGIQYNTEEYDKIDESGFYNVLKKPLSTFAADVDAASYSNARRFIMMDQLPYKDVVRTEEFINYFDYEYKQPDKAHPLSINMEYSDCPWNTEHQLIHIGLKGKELSREEQKPCNLVFLIDVSGSMDTPKKLPLLKKSFGLLVEQLKPEDNIAIVVYAGSAGLVLPATPGSDKKRIMEAIDNLKAGGSTAGGAGIQLAYKTAKENFIKEGNNRVIIATDGDFNVGISSTSELVRYIEEKSKDGIFLTVLGFGMGNYKDHRLQELADRGNGNHAYIDNILEAKKVLVNEITSTLFTIAKDVKIQVEFNPAKIKSYRLLGYENRKLDDKDFKDDKKDAGEIGAGHTVTALYEIVPADLNEKIDNDLKYQDTQIKPDAHRSDELLTVKIRYKEPDGEQSKEIASILKGKPVELNKTTNNFRFSAAVAEYAMILRDSEFKGKSSLNEVLQLAKSSLDKDQFGYRNEFVSLVERTKMLMDKNEVSELELE